MGSVTTSALPTSHPNAVAVTFHLSTFDEAAPLTADGLRRKAEAVRERLAALGAEGVDIVTGAPFLPRCQDMPPEAFLPPERAADLFKSGRRGVRVASYCWRSPGVPDPDGRTLAKIRGHLRVEKGGDRGLFVDVACLPQAFAWPSWHASEAIALRFGAEARQGPLTVLKFEWERVTAEDEAQVRVDKLVSLCAQEGWALASIADFEGCGLPSRDRVGVLFHGRYVSGAYRFDEGAHAEGYVRFREARNAEAARRHPELVHWCGGKEPKPMGERVFENELKFGRALSVMGCLHASATGTCVLQLTAPPGELGDDVAPDELVSERTGTVFVVRTDEALEELRKELRDGVLACEKKSAGEAVVRVDGAKAARAARSLNEGGYPLHRRGRVVYPMYNFRPYGSRGWPTFETAAASIVLAHLAQRKRRGGALPPLVAQAEASGPKLVNINLIGAPHEVAVAPSPERLLRECMVQLRSERRIFFTGRADRQQVLQLLSDFEDSIAVEFDQKRAKHLKLKTEDLEHALTEELREARRARFRKLVRRLTFHVEPMLHLYVSEPTLTVHAAPKAARPEPHPLVEQRSHKGSDRYLLDVGPTKERPPSAKGQPLAPATLLEGLSERAWRLLAPSLDA